MILPSWMIVSSTPLKSLSFPHFFRPLHYTCFDFSATLVCTHGFSTPRLVLIARFSRHLRRTFYLSHFETRWTCRIEFYVLNSPYWIPFHSYKFEKNTEKLQLGLSAWSLALVFNSQIPLMVVNATIDSRFYVVVSVSLDSPFRVSEFGKLKFWIHTLRNKLNASFLISNRFANF
jgi:hypothetical protein